MYNIFPQNIFLIFGSAITIRIPVGAITIPVTWFTPLFLHYEIIALEESLVGTRVPQRATNIAIGVTPYTFFNVIKRLLSIL